MERHVALFLRSALAWLVLGSFLGATMAAHPEWLIYRAVHLHAMLLGFVMLFIAGVAYHVIPRFTMAPLWSSRLAWTHLFLANVGLALMLAGFAGRHHQPAVWLPVLSVGAVASLLGLWAFAWNLWRTLDRAIPTPAAVPRARPLPAARS